MGGDGWCLNCFVHVADLDRHLKVDCPYVARSGDAQPEVEVVVRPPSPDQPGDVELPRHQPPAELEVVELPPPPRRQPPAELDVELPRHQPPADLDVELSRHQPPADLDVELSRQPPTHVTPDLELLELPPPPRSLSEQSLVPSPLATPSALSLSSPLPSTPPRLSSPLPSSVSPLPSSTPPRLSSPSVSSPQRNSDVDDAFMEFDEPIPDHLGFDNIKLLLEEDNRLLTVLLEWTDAERYVVTRKIRWDLPFAAHAMYTSATFHNQRLRIRLLRPKTSGDCAWRQSLCRDAIALPAGDNDGVQLSLSKLDTHYVCQVAGGRRPQRARLFLDSARTLRLQCDDGSLACLDLPEQVPAETIFFTPPGSVAVYPPLRPAPFINVLHLK